MTSCSLYPCRKECTILYSSQNTQGDTQGGFASIVLHVNVYNVYVYVCMRVYARV